MFPDTAWSRVVPQEGTVNTSALDYLAEVYWRPIQGFLQAALGRTDADDLTQEFFAWVMESGFTDKIKPARGTFRGFLKTTLRHFVADKDRRERALKRGGTRPILELSSRSEDDSNQQIPEPAAATLTPELILDREFRADILERAVDHLREHMTTSGKTIAFEVFAAWFLEPSENQDHESLATRFSLSRADISNHLQRTKRLYRESIRVVLMDTVADLDQLAEEERFVLGDDG